MLRPAGGGDSSDTQAPTAPTDLSATAAGPTQVDLSWTAGTDDFGVVEYQVFRYDSRIMTVTVGTTFADTTTVPATSYRYTVKDVDAAGNMSPASEAVTVTTPGGGSDTEATTPGRLRLGECTRDRSPSPTASTDDVGVAGYNVLRDGAQVGTATEAAFTDTDVPRDAAPVYTVSAFDAAGTDRTHRRPCHWTVAVRA